MDSLHTITKLVKKYVFMASIDLKNAYYSIAIKTDDQNFLRFKWDKDTNEFICLPNGLSCAPRQLNKNTNLPPI